MSNASDFHIENGVLLEYRGRDDVVTVPDGVDTIADYAFGSACIAFRIVLPEGVTTIKAHAFPDCRRLETITIPKSICTIGRGAFGNCLRLKKIEVHPENEHYVVKDGMLLSQDGKILLRFFAADTDVEYSIPDGITVIEPHAFQSAKKIKKLTVPSSVISIGSGAFQDMPDLVEADFCGSLDAMEDGLFQGCKRLKSIVWPNNLRTIGCNCFFESGLEDFPIPDTVEEIGSYAFAYIYTDKVVLPKKLKKLGSGVFFGFDELFLPRINTFEVYDSVQTGICSLVWDRGQAESDTYMHTIVVRSADDGSVKFRVHMPAGDKVKVRETFISAWAKDKAAFDFKKTDAIFKDMSMYAKIDYLLDRLFCPDGISDEMLSTLKRFISRNSKKIHSHILENGCEEDLKLLAPYGIT